MVLSLRTEMLFFPMLLSFSWEFWKSGIVFQVQTRKKFLCAEGAGYCSLGLSRAENVHTKKLKAMQPCGKSFLVGSGPCKIDTRFVARELLCLKQYLLPWTLLQISVVSCYTSLTNRVTFSHWKILPLTHTHCGCETIWWGIFVWSDEMGVARR